MTGWTISESSSLQKGKVEREAMVSISVNAD